MQKKHLNIIEQHGEDVIEKLWHKLGYRRAADRLGISVGVLRTIVKNKKWKKPAKYLPNLLKAVKNGSVSADDYPHVSFELSNIDEFGSTMTQFIYTEDVEITLIPSESNDGNFHEKSFLLQININQSNPKED